MTTANKRSFWLPTRPYNIIAAINRVAAATGSVQRASTASNADYNGHFVRVYFNDYRGYWLAEHTWAGRCVHARGSLEQALRAAKAEYDRGALGACVTTEGLDEEGAALALSLGYQVWSEEIEAAHNATWQDGRHGEVAQAFWLEKVGVPALALLIQSKSFEDYKARLDLCTAERGLATARRQWLEEARRHQPSPAEMARIEAHGKELAAKVEALKAQLVTL